MRVSGIPYIQGRNSYSDPDGRKFGIAIHNTSNTATAEAEASYATRRTDGVSSHFYCDSDSVIQSLDTAAKAGHAGSGNGNNNAVAVEITGVNSKTREWWLGNVAWDLLGQVLAQVCRAYGVEVRRARVAEMKANPQVRAFYSHDDMRRAWGGTTHDDPGPGFPWDRLFTAVNAALGAPVGPAAPTSGKGDEMIYRTPNGDCFVATNTGPVQVLAAELTSMASPQIMQVSGIERVQAYCPATPAAAVKVDAAELAAALLEQPSFATALADAAFQGAQRAERE
jgi:hypothetical protein